jgi:hypothetical protein
MKPFHAMLVALLAASVGTGGSAHAAVFLNEILVNPTGGDQPGLNETDWREFVEIARTGVDTLEDTWLLEIEGDGALAGVIDLARDLTGLGFGANGILLLGENYSTLVPWSPVTATVADLERGGIATIENGSISFLIVRGFSGDVGDDVDTDNDGVIESAPWVEVLDSVGWADALGERVYAGTLLTQPSDAPDAAFRQSALGVWVNGNLLDDPPAEGLDVRLDPAASSANYFSGARLTPGEVNVPEPRDLGLAVGIALVGWAVCARRTSRIRTPICP